MTRDERRRDGLIRRYRAMVASPRVAEFTANRLNLVAAATILVVVVCAVFAGPIEVPLLGRSITIQPFQLAPQDPTAQNLDQRLHPPSAEYPLGSDRLGRDLLSRLLYGARLSLQISVVVVSISLAIGTVVGVVAGYVGGVVDDVLMRLVDVVLAFPGILLALVVAGILGPSLTNVMVALAVVGWTQYARVVRGSVLSVKEQDFVKASQLVGLSRPRLVGRHVVPHVISPVIVLATMDMATVVLATAGLSFLGLGAQPPTPEWGTMLASGRNYLQDAWWIANFPGLAIMLTVFAFNILGDSLRDILDPRHMDGVREKGGL